MPAAWFCVLRPARFRHEEGQSGLRAPPGCECLAPGTRTGDEGDEAHPLCQTEAEGPPTLGLTLCDNATPSVQAPREPLRKRQGRCDTVTAVAISQPDTEGQPTIPSHPETEEPRLAVVATLFARPIRRVGGR